MNRKLANLYYKEIDLWIIDIGCLSYSSFIKLKYLLSIAEIKKLDELVFKKDKKIYLVSHVILRLILSFYSKIPPLLIRYKFNCYNKPYIDSNQDLYFSLSHSNNMSIIALSKYEIGVDIEYLNYDISYLEIANNYFELREVNIINSQPTIEKKLRVFYQIWTMKEALLKGIGTGLINGLPKVELYYHKSKYEYLTTFKENTWFVKNLDNFNKNYVASISYLEKNSTINYYNFCL
jgi:4'-phosphopantetheinyl transferase